MNNPGPFIAGAWLVVFGIVLNSDIGAIVTFIGVAVLFRWFKLEADHGSASDRSGIP